MIFVWADTRLAEALQRLKCDIRILPAEVGMAAEGLGEAPASSILLAQAQSDAPALLRSAKDKGMITVLDTAPTLCAAQALAYADVAVADRGQCLALTGVEPISEVHAALAVRSFYASGARSVVMLLDAQGALAAVGQEITYIDEHGMSETARHVFTAALCAALDRGETLVRAVHFASETVVMYNQ